MKYYFYIINKLTDMQLINGTPNYSDRTKAAILWPGDNCVTQSNYTTIAQYDHAFYSTDNDKVAHDEKGGMSNFVVAVWSRKGARPVASMVHVFDAETMLAFGQYVIDDLNGMGGPRYTVTVEDLDLAIERGRVPAYEMPVHGMANRFSHEAAIEFATDLLAGFAILISGHAIGVMLTEFLNHKTAK